MAGAGVTWMERTALLTWYYVRGLCQAPEDQRDRWVERVAGLDEAVLPALLECLHQPTPAICTNVQAALARLTNHWGIADGRTVEWTLHAAREFPHLSCAGQQGILDLTAHWFVGPVATTPAAGLVPACARLLTEVAGSSDPEIQAHALELCAVLLAQPQGPEALSASREVVRTCLRASSPAQRIRAIQLGLHPGMDLLEQVVALLADPVAEVRRAAMLAVGPASQVVRDEGLLPSLHDPDPEVRRLCEAALRARGLRPEHLKLGRLLTDPHPVVRLQVLDQLLRTADLDPGLWLRRLSHDPSPAVRVAALRVMSQQQSVDLSDRIEQMTRSDPSPTVCKLARYYWSCHPRTPPCHHWEHKENRSASAVPPPER